MTDTSATAPRASVSPELSLAKEKLRAALSALTSIAGWDEEIEAEWGSRENRAAWALQYISSLDTYATEESK